MSFDAGSVIGKLEFGLEGWKKSVEAVKTDTGAIGGKVKELSTEMGGLAGSTDQAATSTGGLWKQFVLGTAVIEGLKKGYGLLKDVIKDSIKNAIEQEQADNRLRSALSSTGREVDNNAKHFIAMAKEIMKTTTFTDEQVEAAQALLIQLTTLDRDGLDKATKGAAGLAAVFGTDLDTAARAVAQGFEGNYMTLGRMMPAVRQATTDSEKHAAMMKGLEQAYQRAQAETDTFGGRLKQLNMMWDEAKEAVGSAIIKNEALNKVIKDLKDAVVLLIESGKIEEWTNKFIKGIGALADAVEFFRTQGGSLAKRLFPLDIEDRQKAAIKAVHDFGDSLGVLKPPLAEMRTAIEGGTVSWEAYKNRLKEVDDKLIANKDTITSWMRTGLEKIGLLGKDVVATDAGVAATKALNAAFEALGIKTKVTIESIIALEKNFWLVVNSGQALDEDVRKTAQQLIDFKEKAGQPVSNQLRELAGDFSEAGKKAADMAFISTRELIPGLQGIDLNLRKAGSTFSVFFSPEVFKAIQYIKDSSGQLAINEQKLRTWAQQLHMGVPYIQEAYQNVMLLGMLFAGFKVPAPDFKPLLQSTITACIDVSSKWADLMRDITQGWADGFKQMVEGTMSFKDFLGDTWEAIKTAFFRMIADMVVGWITDGINNIIDGAKDAEEKSSKSFKGIATTIGDVAKSIVGVIKDIATAILGVIELIAKTVVDIVAYAIETLAKSIAAAAKALAAAAPDLMIVGAIALALFAGFKAIQALFGGGGPSTSAEDNILKTRIAVQGLLNVLMIDIRDNQLNDMIWWLGELGRITTDICQKLDNIADLITIKIDNLAAIMNTSGFWNLFISLKSDIVGAIDRVTDAIKGISGAQFGHISTRPELIMTHGTPSIPEITFPINQMPAFNSNPNIGGNKTIVNINSPLIMTSGLADNDLQRAGRKLLDIIERQVESRGRGFAYSR